jgi:uncharacterized OsmC-like protein
MSTARDANKLPARAPVRGFADDKTGGDGAMSAVRRYEVAARSTDTFGRVLVSTRDQHFVADGPVHNGCPGEAVTPAELFLAGVASCAVELVQVLAHADQVPLARVATSITGEIDPDNPVRSDVSVFNSVRLQLHLAGVTHEQGEELVTKFKGR